MTGKTIYIIDSSMLISLKDFYPLDLFERLWNFLEDSIKRGLLITHEMVIKEINEGKDDLVIWVNNMKKKYKNFVISHNEDIQEIVEKILQNDPCIAQPSKNNPYHADPFIIALAIYKIQNEKSKLQGFRDKYIIATTEVDKYPNKPMQQRECKIPRICDRYTIPYVITAVDLLRGLNWKM